jgi:hypothetical protein
MNAKMLSIAAVAGVLLGSTALVQAEEKMGGPGASGATPGHEMQERGSLPGHPGASGYAPGHATTGAADRDDRKFGDRDGDRDDRRGLRGDRDDRKNARRDHDRDDRRGARGDRDDKMTGFGGRDRDDRKFDRDDHKKIDYDKR